ncbi:MAG: polysaccharide biosynthesis tyrosine autokinase [Elainella sp. Prado103]|jgi:capsular exopolysaccharide synthesis family protein|nr:polysaccharide biosynthesis tyrosine autokinase [Elainella sp. Prado103]
MTEAKFNPSSEPEFGYGQLFGMLLRRWVWIACAVGVGLAGGTYVSMNQRPVYISSMQLIVEPNFDNELTEADLTGVSNWRVSDTDYATQLNLMRSAQFIEQTVDKLKQEYPGLTAEIARGSFSLNRVVEKDSKNPIFTRIFEARYIDGDPIRSQKFLETIKQIYLNYNQQKQSERLEQGLRHVNERLANTRDNLERAQAALEQFRQRQNLIDPAYQAQATVEALNQIQQNQRQLLSEISSTKSRYQALQQRLALSPQSAIMAARLSQSSRIQGLLNALQKTNLELANRRILFTDQDPEVQRFIEQQKNELAALRQEIAAITQQPSAELDPSLLSLLQLGAVDLQLVADLIETDATLRSLDARWQSLQGMEGQLRAAINNYPTLIAEYDRLQPSVEIERNTLKELLVQREQLSAELARDGFSWDVIVQPTLGAEIGSNSMRFILMGGVVGLFIGGALALARESMDQVVHTSDDLKKQVPLPLLGILPSRSSRRLPLSGANSNIAIGTLHPELADSDLIQTILCPPFRESLDLIANSLQLLQTERTSQVIGITSGLPGEGKTTLTLGLALSLARMNQQVLVIDADLRRSGIQRDLGLSFEGGLSTYLQGKPGSNPTHRLDFDGKYVDILPAGASLHDPITLLSSPRFERLLKRSKELYDVVLIDTPPVLGMADALKVGAACDSTVIVTRLDKITQQELNEVMSAMAPIHVLGIVANGARDGSARHINYTSSTYKAYALRQSDV